MCSVYDCPGGLRLSTSNIVWSHVAAHQLQLAIKNSIMFTVIVQHQLSGHHHGVWCLADRRNRSAPMIATLARTFAADSQRGAFDRKRLITAAGSNATDPHRQIRPRSPQYKRRRSGDIKAQDAPIWTTHVKLGTTMPTMRTSGSSAVVVSFASDPEKIAVTAPPAANHIAVVR